MNNPNLLAARITGKRPVSSVVCEFALSVADGSVLPDFTPGAHIDVHLEGGLIRQYSICNGPDDRDAYRIAVQKEADGRGGSRFMHESIRTGDKIYISAPRNHFMMVGSARDSLLFAGGIGITPLLSMARHLHSMGAAFQLHYHARSKERAAYVRDLETSPWRDHVHLHFNDDSDRRRRDLRSLLARREPQTHVYTCGPRGYMDAILGIARETGWPEDALHSEAFANDRSLAGGEVAFDVRIASSGSTVRVGATESIVEALARVGIEVPVSCEQGMCGTCLTGVLEGIPDHRDVYLTEKERAANDRCLPCCARARTTSLLLDL